MNTPRNILLARKAITERAHRAHSFVVDTRAIFDRSPAMGLIDHGLALSAAGDLIA
jgi:hypothetical protein